MVLAANNRLHSAESGNGNVTNCVSVSFSLNSNLNIFGFTFMSPNGPLTTR